MPASGLAAGLAVGSGIGRGVGLGGDRPVVRLGFADGTVLLLAADDPLARELRSLADSLLHPAS